MLRALSTAGQGMIAQQMNVDVISNNLANVNTTGFKKERIEFKDLLYETMQKSYLLDGQGKPVNLQVGLGVTPVATVKNFGVGNFEKTDNPLDFAIDGEGFFKCVGPKGDAVYTKDGSFKISLSDNGNQITTSEGYPILDQNGESIYLNSFNVSDMIVSNTGDISYLDKASGGVVPTGQKIGLFKFKNMHGLESIGGNFYAPTSATGDAIPDADYGAKTVINQNFLEASNVQVVEEMVKLITAQRAYDINSKSIQTADEMLNTANSLKR